MNLFDVLICTQQQQYLSRSAMNARHVSLCLQSVLDVQPRIRTNPRGFSTIARLVSSSTKLCLPSARYTKCHCIRSFQYDIHQFLRAHQFALIGLEKVTHRVVMRALLARAPLPKVKGVGKEGCRESQATQLGHGVLQVGVQSHIIFGASMCTDEARSLGGVMPIQ